MGRKVLTIEMIAQLYQLAKGVYLGTVSITKAKEEAEFVYGINPNTADGIIRNLSHMLAGEKYVRTMSDQLTRYFLDNILIDFGQEALSAALMAIRKHREYYEKRVNKLPYLAQILRDYQ